MKNWQLHFRLMFSVGFIVAIGVVLITAYNYQIAREYIISETRLKAINQVSLSVNELLAELAGVQKSTELLAQVVQDFTGSETKLRELLKNAISTNANLFGGAIAINPKLADMRGGFAPYYYHQSQMVRYANLAEMNADYEDQGWYREVAEKGQPIWSEPYFDDKGGMIHMITYAVPVFRTIEGERQLYAVVTGDVSLELINNIIQRLQLGKTGYAFLLDENGRVLSEPNDKYLLQPFSELLNQYQADPEWHQLLAEMLAGKEGLTQAPCIRSNDECIVAYVPLSITGWPIGLLYPESELLSQLHQYTLQFSIMSATALLTLLLVIGFVTRQVTYPLSELSDAARHIGAGQFNRRLPRLRRRDEIGTLIRAFDRMQKQLKDYVEQLESETANRNRLEGELGAASKIQMDMLYGQGLAQVHEKAFRLWAHLLPAKTVGGDFYDYNVRNNTLTFVVGDVSDKGVGAALFMAKAISLFRQQVSAQLPIDEMIAELNEGLMAHNDACMFVTLLCGQLDLASGQLNYVCAGHQAPLLIRKGKAGLLKTERQSALGLLEDIQYPTNTVQLNSGDKLFLFTDGIDEAFNQQHEIYGVERLQLLLAETAAEPVEAIGEACFHAVHQFSGDNEQSDDMTVMVVEFQPTSQFIIEHTFEQQAVRRFVLANELPSIQQAFKHLDAFCEEYQLSGSHAGELKLLTEEILNNAISYGQMRADDNLVWQLVKVSSGVLMEFIDVGIAYNPLVDAPPPELFDHQDEVPIGGLGVHLIKAISHQQAYARKGRCNHLAVFYRFEQAG
ncbi:Methyl-accepting chemotaxis protein McpA [BD1-7 clade bacterium]|uniref:Methyl-accepting chemotaxis protein McpA n=1 Tax=BD1-7 clade bacterium TaxID=2029982 RepID=A0A5S9MZT0_9GAMM|nr:Methyl-accepting chemotaxis protein McpA [BD1-7 clade bacterium]CAA0082866.1 Methyl-accepting chemotaxis protein McpA [BD1-7 clade bacterium]